jgi:hypothetical protein
MYPAQESQRAEMQSKGYNFLGIYSSDKLEKAVDEAIRYHEYHVLRMPALNGSGEAIKGFSSLYGTRESAKTDSFSKSTRKILNAA